MRPDSRESLHDLGLLVQKALPDLDDSFDLARGERRFVATVRGEIRPKRAAWRRLAIGTASLAAAAFIVFFGVARLRGPSATYVVRGASVANGYVAAADESASIDFSDGSEVRLASGGAARIESFEQDRAVLVLEHGSAHVRVVHRASTKWTIRCGAYLVSIRGTEFDIAWSRANETLRIDLHSGSIAVEGGAMQNEFLLLAGQSAVLDRDGVKIARTRDEPPAVPSDLHQGSLGDSPAGSATPDDTAPRGADSASAPPLRSGSDATAAPGAPSSAKVVRSWSASVQAGEYDEVLEQARSLGIDGALQQSSLNDLEALADAARYRRAGDIARRCYLAVRERFPATEYAKQAAWMLGRLSESSAPGDALAWFERYRSESPRGPYAGEALGRAMLVSERTGQHARARDLAQRYLREQASGAFAGSAGKILASP